MPSTPRRRQHHSNQGRDIGKPIHNGGEVHLDQICESPVGEVAKRHGIELHSLSTIGMHRKRIVRVTLKQTHIKKTKLPDSVHKTYRAVVAALSVGPSVL